MEPLTINKTLIERFNETEIESFYEYELKQCARLDLNRTVEISGYYYDPDDTTKTHAHFKDGCLFIGDASLNAPLLVAIIRSSDLVEVVYNIQSLHTDKFGEGMLTTWIEIKHLILLLTDIESTKILNEHLKNWHEKGVTEIYLSWYENK